MATGDLIAVPAADPGRLATGDLQPIAVPPTADVLSAPVRPTQLAPPLEQTIRASSLGVAQVEARPTEPVTSERATIAAGEGELFGIVVPAGIEMTDPLSPSLFLWVNAMVKAVRGLRFYAENNATLREYVDTAVVGLLDLLERSGEISLSVREDRILYSDDVIHVNSDRVDGLPFILFRNSLRRMTFLRGISKDELIQLLTAIMTDFNTHELAGEDLISTLWRMNLKHFKYATADTLAVTSMSTVTSTGLHGAGQVVDHQRIQADIEAITEALSTNEASPDDILAGMSISQDDLDAYATIRSRTADEVDKDLFDFARELSDGGFDEEQLDTIVSELYEDNGHDALVHRIVDLIVEALIRGETGDHALAATEVLVQLSDANLRRRLYRDATALVSRLRKAETNAEVPRERDAASRLLTTLSAESRLIHAINALNDRERPAAVTELFDMLRAFGSYASETLLELLDFVEQPPHRRVVCEVIAESGMPPIDRLLHKMNQAKAPVALDILALAHRLPPDEVAPLLLKALEHNHPRVRAQAVGYLRGYPHGTADVLLAKAIQDADFDVRVAAIRIAAARRSQEAARAIEDSLESGEVFQRDRREQRMVLTAYAKIAGDEGVPHLSKVLTPGLFARRRTVEAQTAAASALGMIHSPDAVEALKKGARTLNKKVREACRKALSAEAAVDGELDSARPTLAVDALASKPITEHEPPAGMEPMHMPMSSPAEAPKPLRAAPPRLPTNALTFTPVASDPAEGGEAPTEAPPPRNEGAETVPAARRGGPPPGDAHASAPRIIVGAPAMEADSGAAGPPPEPGAVIDAAAAAESASAGLDPAAAGSAAAGLGLSDAAGPSSSAEAAAGLGPSDGDSPSSSAGAAAGLGLSDADGGSSPPVTPGLGLSDAEGAGAAAGLGPVGPDGAPSSAAAAGLELADADGSAASAGLGLSDPDGFAGAAAGLGLSDPDGFAGAAAGLGLSDADGSAAAAGLGLSDADGSAGAAAGLGLSDSDGSATSAGLGLSDSDGSAGAAAGLGLSVADGSSAASAGLGLAEPDGASRAAADLATVPAPVAPVAPESPSSAESELASSMAEDASPPSAGQPAEAAAAEAPTDAPPPLHEPLPAPVVDLASDLGPATAPPRLPSSAFMGVPDELLDAYEVEEFDDDEPEDETLRASPLAEPIKPPVPGREYADESTRVERGPTGDDD